MDALRIEGLTKKYGDKIAVDNLNLSIPYGSIYGIVGPNGAGKTTTLTMVCGITKPDAGTAWIAGHETGTLESKKAMGLLMDGAPVFEKLSGAEYLQYLGALRSMAEEEVQERSRELLSALGLADAATKYIGDYSAGMSKKILLAGAILHDPEVLILDEPLEAVDPVSSRLVQQLLRSYAARGGTVVLSSHVMELVEGLCDHVALINNGQVAVDGPLDEVRQGKRSEERRVGKERRARRSETAGDNMSTNELLNA